VDLPPRLPPPGQRPATGFMWVTKPRSSVAITASPILATVTRRRCSDWATAAPTLSAAMRASRSRSFFWLTARAMRTAAAAHETGGEPEAAESRHGHVAALALLGCLAGGKKPGFLGIVRGWAGGGWRSPDASTVEHRMTAPTQWPCARRRRLQRRVTTRLAGSPPRSC